MNIFMKPEELWKYFLDKKVSYKRHYGRDFLWILKEDFMPMEKYFKKEFNLFHPKEKSFRSEGYFSHIHALYRGDYVFIHKDMGNVARFLPLGILHIFFDLIPLLFFIIINRKEISTKD